jgi:hypothetical protein
MASAAMEVKSTTHGASLRPKILDARPHDLPPDVITGQPNVAAPRHRTIDLPATAVPSEVIPAVRRSRLDPPVRVAFRPAQCIPSLCIRAVTLDVRKTLEKLVVLDINTIPQSLTPGGFVGWADALKRAASR